MTMREAIITYPGGSHRTVEILEEGRSCLWRDLSTMGGSVLYRDTIFCFHFKIASAGEGKIRLPLARFVREANRSIFISHRPFGKISLDRSRFARSRTPCETCRGVDDRVSAFLIQKTGRETRPEASRKGKNYFPGAVPKQCTPLPRCQFLRCL